MGTSFTYVNKLHNAQRSRPMTFFYARATSKKFRSPRIGSATASLQRIPYGGFNSAPSLHRFYIALSIEFCFLAKWHLKYLTQWLISRIKFFRVEKLSREPWWKAELRQHTPGLTCLINNLYFPYFPHSMLQDRIIKRKWLRTVLI